MESTLFSPAPKNPEWITAAVRGIERNEDRGITGPYTECDEDEMKDLKIIDENDVSCFEESSAIKEQKVEKKSHRDSKHKVT